jgi:hypothetical protein
MKGGGRHWLIGLLLLPLDGKHWVCMEFEWSLRQSRMGYMEAFDNLLDGQGIDMVQFGRDGV